MSADNGIYILVTKGPEYRVAHAQAIEDIHFGVRNPDYEWNEKSIVEKFGKVAVSSNKAEALDIALKMSKQCSVLEYGISWIDYSNKEFPT